MDSFVFCCEHCGKSIKADVADRGAQADCPYCNKPIVIPQLKTIRITSCSSMAPIKTGRTAMVKKQLISPEPTRLNNY